MARTFKVETAVAVCFTVIVEVEVDVGIVRHRHADEIAERGKAPNCVGRASRFLTGNGVVVGAVSSEVVVAKEVVVMVLCR